MILAIGDFVTFFFKFVIPVVVPLFCLQITGSS